MTRATPPRASATALPWRHIPRPPLIQVTLLACVLAVFLPVCSYDFLNFDDDINVYNNYHVTDFSFANLLYFWKGFHQNLFIPLTYTLWGLLANLSDLFPAAAGGALQPSVFHALNLFLHGGSTLALFHILRLLLKHDWAAGAGALLFAVHPVQVETVAWVTGLKDALCGFFSILALWQYLSFAATNAAGQPWRDKRYTLATLFLTAALLSKPSAVTLPLTAALLSSFLSPRSARQLALELGPWLLLAAPFVLITKFAQPTAHHSFVPAFWQRFLIAGDAISFYLGKLLFPVTLGPDYGRTPQSVLTQGWLYVNGLLPYLMAVPIFWKCRKPWSLTAAGAFLAPLLPVLGFISFDFQDLSTVADRYLYMAMLGPALGLSWLALQSRKHQSARFALITLLALLGVKSATQVRVWQNSLSFNTHAVQVNPQSPTAYLNLGADLKEANRLQEAIAALQRSLDLAPQYPQAYIILGDIARETGDPVQALNSYKLALGVQANSARAYANLGLTYMDMNQPAEAIASFLKAIAIEPDFAEVYSNLGILYEPHDQGKAASMYQKAMAINPDLGEAANNLGYLYLEMNRANEAIPLFQRAIAASPGPMAYNNLGLAYVNLGQRQEAADCFQKAITLEAGFGPALINLSKVELQLGNLPAALELADQARARGFDDPEHFRALQKHRR